MSTKRKFEEDPAQRSSRKRTRADKDDEFTLFADASVDGCGLFSKLPKELFQKVCKLLFTRDILNMTETSKAMNKMISLDPQIMKSIKLRIPTHDKLTEVNFGQRIYPTIIYRKHPVGDFHLYHYENCIKKIASEVKTISFPDYFRYVRIDMNCTVAIKVLKMMPNIQAVLSIPVHNLRPHERCLKPLNLPFLKELNTDCGGETNFFATCSKLETLTGNACSRISSERLKRILKIQTSLQSLSIRGSNYLFANFDSSEIKFKLKSLSISFIRFDEENLQTNFESFANLHRDTLVKLALGSLDPLPIFQNFSMLKEIELRDVFIGLADVTIPSMFSVEKLTVVNSWGFSRKEFSMIDCFPNLKEFRGVNILISQKWTHNRIEKIFMESSYFLNFSMPKLKSIEFVDMKFDTSIMRDCENVSEMRLNKCSFFGDLLASVTQQSKNLKIVVFQNMTLSKGYKKYLSQLDEKITVKY